MFAEFIYITLAVCLLLCACTEDDLAYGMSFETLLKRTKLWNGPTQTMGRATNCATEGLHAVTMPLLRRFASRHKPLS